LILKQKLVYLALGDLASWINQKFTESIIFNYSIYQLHPAQIPRVQKAKADQERLFSG
jgi:hypothetical protein